MVDVLSKYSIEEPLYEELDDVFDVLSKVLVRGAEVSIETTTMDERKLRNTIKYAYSTGNITTLQYDGVIVGVVITAILKHTTFIRHSNIITEHKKTLGSAILFNHIVNVKFPDTPIHIVDITDEYVNVVEKSDATSTYLITDKAREIIKKSILRG